MMLVTCQGHWLNKDKKLCLPSCRGIEESQMTCQSTLSGTPASA